MNIVVVEWLFKFVVGSGLLACIYRLYVSFTEHAEHTVESKETDQINKDLERNKSDADQAKKSTDDFNDVVNKYKRDSE